MPPDSFGVVALDIGPDDKRMSLRYAGSCRLCGASIDHIAVGPSGVWVIDAKRYKDKRPILHVEGGTLRPRVESLRVGGRDRTSLVDGIRSQVDRVTAALGDLDIPVMGVLCFLEADWPLVGGSFTVSGITVTWPRALVSQITTEPSAAIDVAGDEREWLTRRVSSLRLGRVSG